MKYDLTYRSDVKVTLVRADASDTYVAQAARVSVLGANEANGELSGLINHLMKHRHGSPFEHAMFTFHVEAPIFVFREWHRHRIASINEMSGRYMELLPHFYTPDAERELVNSGTSARPEFVAETTTGALRDAKRASDELAFQVAWGEYQSQLNLGIANELARTVLPVSVYSQMYWTVNPRALMNFLSLRTDARRYLEDPAVFSRPQREIEMGAEKVEDYFALHMPITHAAFVANGRVAP